jgi:hypothetical protein
MHSSLPYRPPFLPLRPSLLPSSGEMTSENLGRGAVVGDVQMMIQNMPYETVCV